MNPLQKDGAEHGRQRQGDHGRDKDGDGKRYGKFPEKTPGDILHEEEGNEHGHKGEGQGDDGEANLACPCQRCLHRAHALLKIARDVFDDDNGVIDYEACGYDQGHERQVVEGKACQVEHAQRAHQGERDCQCRNDGSPYVAQKEQYDGNDHDDSQHKLNLDIGNGCPDGGCPVGYGLYFDRGRQGGLQGCYALADGIGYGNDVGAWLALYGEDDGWLYFLP